LARKESQEDILIRNAVANLDASNPVNVILADIINNDLYHPSSMDSEENYDFDLYELFDEDNIDETVTTTDSDLDKTSGISSNFDYNDFSHPDYLSTVAGQTITMPNGEVRTYSSDGTSYSIPAESWMGIGDSTYQITTHNQLSGAAYENPEQRYVGISFNQARPAATAAATGNPWWLTEYGLNALPGVLGWLWGNNSGNTEDTKKSNASGTHTTSHGSVTSTGKVE